MLTLKQVEEGFEFLGIDDKNLKDEIISACLENHYYMKEEEVIKKSQQELEERIKNRFVVPYGKTKKEYLELKKETQKMIDDLKTIIQLRPDNSDYPEELKEKYIEKKKKIEFILKTPKGEINIKKAKDYQIDFLIDFDSNGFAKRCPNHSQDTNQKTPSLKYYRKSNTCYCFVCNQKFDAIDIYMKLYNVTLVEAVKKLSI